MLKPIDLLPELKSMNDSIRVSPLNYLACHARSDIAVAYLNFFWPEFIMFEGYIFRTDFKKDLVRSWQQQANVRRQDVEAAVNYLDIGYLFGESLEEHSDLKYARESLIRSSLVEIYNMKLMRDFPDFSFRVLPITDDTELALTFYQI